MYAKDIETKCANCVHGEPMTHKELEIICEYNGIVAYNYTCRKFKYDVFKKKIRRKNGLDTPFTADDFSID